jgi:hypothetical protein
MLLADRSYRHSPLCPCLACLSYQHSNTSPWPTNFPGSIHVLAHTWLRLIACPTNTHVHANRLIYLTNFLCPCLSDTARARICKYLRIPGINFTRLGIASRLLKRLINTGSAVPADLFWDHPQTHIFIPLTDTASKDYKKLLTIIILSPTPLRHLTHVDKYTYNDYILVCSSYVPSVIIWTATHCKSWQRLKT